MRKLFIIPLLLFTALVGMGQSKRIDTLRAALGRNTALDTTRLNLLKALSHDYFISKPDSSLLFGQLAYDLAIKFKRLSDQAYALNYMANSYTTLGDYTKGFPLYLKAIRIYESMNNLPGVVKEYNNLGSAYVSKQDYLKGLPYLQTGLKKWLPYTFTHKLQTHDERSTKALLFVNIGEVFLNIHKIDSANYYLQIAYADAKKNDFIELLDVAERDLGEVETAKGNKAAALKFYRNAVSHTIPIEDVQIRSVSYLSMANLFHKFKQQDSAEYYAQKALDAASSQSYLQDVYNAGKVLYAYYEEDNNLSQAYKYLKITTATKDSLFSQDKVKQLLSIDFDEKQRLRDLEAAQVAERDRIRMYLLIAGMAILLVLAIIFWLANKQRRKAYNLLRKQKEEIDLQKAKVEHTLGELKSTQTQLVQSEKMASLGELTAGIAHEIQNPLNFVNNFSDVSIELLEEMEAELKLGHVEDAVDIAGGVKQNLEKISHHGKRADSIVKGMLQHSRASSNQKEPTDINVLADEYFRLAYHGLRAKDKSFNAEMVTDFAGNLPKAAIVPQDIGRVLLNLFNNAFYAVIQKTKTAGPDYKPTVELSTATEGDFIEIKVKDNGNGIPEHIKDKIMQPFFTTKPTGEGTGLGLSMSYDIVVKGHGGSITVDTKEGEFTEFTLKLPL